MAVASDGSGNFRRLLRNLRKKEDHVSGSIWVAFGDDEAYANSDKQTAEELRDIAEPDWEGDNEHEPAIEYVARARSDEPMGGERGNLIRLVERLSRRLPEGDKMREQAADYLMRIGHFANILRDES